jgi:hypothetical protein
VEGNQQLLQASFGGQLLLRCRLGQIQVIDGFEEGPLVKREKGLRLLPLELVTLLT